MSDNVSSEGQLAAARGYRVYLIRKALGPDARHEMSQRRFAELLNAKAQEIRLDVAFDGSAITRIEKGERRLQLDEVTVIAAVDPEARGREWLAWPPIATIEQPDIPAPRRERGAAEETG